MVITQMKAETYICGWREEVLPNKPGQANWIKFTQGSEESMKQV